MSVQIGLAEAKITSLLPQATKLAGEINSLGTYLIFDHLNINNALIGDVDYVFNLFVAISSNSKDNKLIYQPLDNALTILVDAYQLTQAVEVGNIKPYSIKGLIIYKIPLTVRGFKGEDYV